MRNSTPSSTLSQCFLRRCKNAITPVMLNSGSHAPSEAHLDSESGVKLGRAGISGGKKKHSRICRYRWGMLYSSAFHPWVGLSTRGFCSTARHEGISSSADIATPSTDSNKSHRKSFTDMRQLRVMHRTAQ